MSTPTTVADIDAIIGTPPKMISLKVTSALDDGCREVFAAAPAAALGIRDTAGVPRTMLVGGTAGFARAESKNRLSLPIPDGAPLPALGTGASMVFLIPGLGETFRLNGTAAGTSDGRVAIDMTEAYMHCARCMLRSKLWTAVPDSPPTAPPVPADGPLSTPGVAAFLASSPFAAISSRDGEERADTSPRGDGPGFLHLLDGATIALPDRRGNKRADTLRNLMTCPDVSLAALLPGSDQVLHLTGTAEVSTDPELLATMALRDKPPHAAIVVHVEHADLRQTAVANVLWNGPRDPEHLPDLTGIAAAHVAANTEGGRAARLLGRGLAAAPGALTRRAMDASYRSALRDEGY